MSATSRPSPARNRASRLVLDHARAPVVRLLRDLGFHTQAAELSAAPSLSALRFVAAGINNTLHNHMRRGPRRRATVGAVTALHSAALLGMRGDEESAAVMALGAFTHAARAQAWHRRWWQLPRWKAVRARVLAQARAEQIAVLNAPPESLSP